MSVPKKCERTSVQVTFTEPKATPALFLLTWACGCKWDRSGVTECGGAK